MRPRKCKGCRVEDAFRSEVVRFEVTVCSEEGPADASGSRRWGGWGMQDAKVVMGCVADVGKVKDPERVV